MPPGVPHFLVQVGGEGEIVAGDESSFLAGLLGVLGKIRWFRTHGALMGQTS